MNHKTKVTLCAFLVSGVLCVVEYYLLGWWAAAGMARIGSAPIATWYEVNPGHFLGGLVFIALTGPLALVVWAVIAISFLTWLISGFKLAAMLLKLGNFHSAIGTRDIVIVVAAVGVILAIPLLAGLVKKSNSATGDPNAIVNIEGIGSVSALAEAIWNGDREKVQAFLNQGANLRDPIRRKPSQPGNGPMEGTSSALMFGIGAVEAGKATPDFLQYLIDNGADVNCRDSWGGFPLILATTSDRLSQTGDVVRLLLKDGADPNAQYENGMTVLHIAAMQGRTAIVEVLLKSGANANTRCSAGTPLSSAKEKGHVDVIELLLRYGAME